MCLEGIPRAILFKYIDNISYLTVKCTLPRSLHAIRRMVVDLDYEVRYEALSRPSLYISNRNSDEANGSYSYAQDGGRGGVASDPGRAQDDSLSLTRLLLARGLDDEKWSACLALVLDRLCEIMHSSIEASLISTNECGLLHHRALELTRNRSSEVAAAAVRLLGITTAAFSGRETCVGPTKSEAFELAAAAVLYAADTEQALEERLAAVDALTYMSAQLQCENVTSTMDCWKALFLLLEDSEARVRSAAAELAPALVGKSDETMWNACPARALKVCCFLVVLWWLPYSIYDVRGSSSCLWLR